MSKKKTIKKEQKNHNLIALNGRTLHNKVFKVI